VNSEKVRRTSRRYRAGQGSNDTQKATVRIVRGDSPPMEKPRWGQRGFSHGIKRREVEKRIYGLKEAAHGFHNLHAHIIKGAFERRMEELKTKNDKFMNNYF